MDRRSIDGVQHPARLTVSVQLTNDLALLPFLDFAVVLQVG